LKVKLANGTDAEISADEAKRIAGEMHNEPHTYLKRAIDNIEAVSGERPASEDELKEILYENIPGLSKNDVELLYEAMEAIVGWYATKSM